MGKRSSFERRERDFYPTPESAVLPLLSHLLPHTRFCEPCAGDGALVDHLTKRGHICVRTRDIEPRRDDIERKDALTTLTGNIDCFITNPPWDRSILHPLILFLSNQAPTWLLFDADWVHTVQASPYLSRLRKIVSVGRVKWIPGTTMTGKDNCAWHLFDDRVVGFQSAASFYGRAK